MNKETSIPIDEQKFKYLMDHQKNMNIKSIDLEKYNLEVKESLIKGSGLGLFTKTKIPKESIICYYPCDIIQAPETDLYFENGEEVSKDKYSEEELKEIKYGDYNFNLYPFCIIAKEGFKENKMYVGNFMNDKGYKVNKVYKKSLNNCTIHGLDVVSLRNIEAGEELYYGYGNGYWYEKDENVKYSRNQLIKNKVSGVK